MIDPATSAAAIAAAALVTFALRALPFLAARWLRAHPLVQRLGRFLPLAIMTILLLHALAGAAGSHAGGPWPELAAAALALAMQWKLRHPLTAILAATALYVLLRNLP
ncbi:MAG: hypothetical protein RJA99_4301 [Pseudomonadota bacterium]|jgi:branched-subunit amino acid transport protein AzlD